MCITSGSNQTKAIVNQPNATASKDDTPEQTKEVIILGDSIVKQVRRYDL